MKGVTFPGAVTGKHVPLSVVVGETLRVHGSLAAAFRALGCLIGGHGHQVRVQFLKEHNER